MTVAEERKKMWEGIQWDSTYAERDLAIERLQDEFYSMCGIDVDNDVVTMLGDDYEEHLSPGFCIGVTEEFDFVFKDFVLIGQMGVSCRGMLYRLSCEFKDGQQYEATNISGLVKEDGADRWLKGSSSLWENQ